MDFLVNKFRIRLNNLIEEYREKGIPSYIISGVVAQETVRLKERELAELTLEHYTQLQSNKDDNSDE